MILGLMKYLPLLLYESTHATARSYGNTNYNIKHGYSAAPESNYDHILHFRSQTQTDGA